MRALSLTLFSLLSIVAAPLCAQDTAAANDRQVTVQFPPVQELIELKTLPDPFLGPGGKRIEKREQWPQQREYLKALLAHYMYGQMPPRPAQEQVAIRQTHSRPIFDGAAIEEHYTLTVSRNGKAADLAMALIRPREKKRYPAIIKNCRVLFDKEGINKRFEPIVDDDLAAAADAVRRGYLLCKFRREDFAPDREENRELGIFPLYPDYDWGSIAVWAWTHQLVFDALDRLECAETRKVIYTGHSRGGQTAIAAGIFDERVAIVAPNTGGYGSCATLRIRDPKGARGTLDYIAHLGQKNKHWFHPRYYQFAGNQNKIPFDAHTLVALIAPRPLLNTNATEDPYNNTLSIEAGLRTGKQVYDWLGAGDLCRLHWRPGTHAQQQEDWQALFDLADEVFFDRPGTSNFNQWVYPELKSELNWSVP